MGRKRRKPIASSTTTESNDVKIVMRNTAAGPDGVLRPGMVADVPEPRAKEMLERGFARQYDREKDKAAIVGPIKAPEQYDG